MENRNPPAYQEYAATILAQIPFRTMTLQDRGLLFTMRLECWVNVRLPQTHNELAKVLGVSVSEIAGSLDAVMHFFDVVDGWIISPELENYRQHLDDIRQRQSEGGKRGSATTNSKRNPSKRRTNTNDEGNTATNSQAPCQGEVESLVQSSTVKQSQDQPLGNGNISDVVNEWVNEYEQTENDYAKVRS